MRAGRPSRWLPRVPPPRSSAWAAGELSGCAAHVRVPVVEHAAWVVLPGPGVQLVERRQAVPVPRRAQLELLPEQRWARAVVRVPCCLERDVLDGYETQSPVSLRLVNERLGLGGIDHTRSDEP